MRKLVEKIAIVALVCVTMVFVLMAVLYATDIIKIKEGADNSVTIVVLGVLGALYVGLSTYLIVVNFSEAINVKKILLFYDVKGTTHASNKIVTNIVRGCVKEFPKLKLKKVTLRVDDKMDLIANVKVNATDAEDIRNYVPQLRQLLEESFWDALSLKFCAINIEVLNLSKKFIPTDAEVESARQITPQTELDEEQIATTEQVIDEQVVVEQVVTQDDFDHKQDDIANGEKIPTDA